MIGRTISHYTILEELGRGGMGVVYKAEDTRLHRAVAIKFLSRALLALGAGEKERFEREAQAASKLDHPSITTVYAIEEQDGEIFIVMGYVEGETLRKHVAAHPSGLPVDEAVALAIRIAEGLEAAHEQGIIHRDIKSDNIMVTPRGGVKIMDFGLAKLKGAGALTRTGSTVGTIGFMAPEQIQHEDIDQRADIWSFGILLFEMLTGRLPFRGEHEAAMMYSILNEAPQKLRDFRPDVAEGLERIVDTLLAKDRNARYSSMGDVVRDLRAVQAPVARAPAENASGRSVLRLLKRPAIGIPAAFALLAAIGLAYYVIHWNARSRWAFEEALPTMDKLVDERRLPDAYALGVEAERYLGSDSAFVRLMRQCSFRLYVETSPGGAAVAVKPYAAPDSAWQQLGTTPLRGVRLAREPMRLRMTRAGSLPSEMILAPYWDGGNFPKDDTLSVQLDSVGTHPADMVHVKGGLTALNLVGLEQEPAVRLGDYLMDRFEVTNKAYKAFVDAGGYIDRKYWRFPFMQNGREIPWAEGIGRFRDATGRPGPAAWEMGSYPEGRGDYPVSGVSWYEAAAFAEYAGKQLPTIYQWNHAAGTPRSSLIVPLSNFSSQGPAPAGVYNGLGSYGTYDMAGNVKEWVFNEAGSGKRYILGGAWGEPRYMFNDPDAQSPFARNVTFGFRCAKPVGEVRDPEETYGPVVIPVRDFAREHPVSDNIFSVFRTLYSYDPEDLRATIEMRDSSSEYWIREKISFAAAYGNERVVAYLYLPRRTPPPYQAVVYFPGSNAIHQRSSEQFLEVPRIDLIIKSGRAVIYPVYKSTYERGDGLNSDVPDSTVYYRDHMIMWYKDCSRSIDYLETRPDINREKLAFVGFSWGAVTGNIITAIEKRFRAVVLVAGGLCMQRSFPEVEQLNFVPRITAPTLMMNGRYDFFFPVETSQLPMFNLLRMPESQKKKVVFETGHSVPRVEAFREILDWLDRYLGPVNR